MNVPQPPYGQDPRDWHSAPPPPSPGGPSWDQLFELDDTRRPGVRPRAPENRVGPKLAVAGIGLVALAAVIVLVVWLVRPGGGGETATTATTTASSAQSEAQVRLESMVPAGYSPDSCQTVEATDGALAVMSCDQNSDSGGPLSATYTLVKDRASLTEALNRVVGAATTVECPGRVQSPGPWRRNAMPQQISGIVFCGIQQNQPMVAWTDEAKLLLSEVHGDTKGSTLAQLYAWWASHS